MEEGKCTFESTASASSRQELYESQKSSRRSRIPKSIHWRLVGSNRQEVWFGSLGRREVLERGMHI